MNKNTQKITMGAAIVAIFTIMLLLNRQTGSFFQEIFLFLFPIPMVAYAAKYGWKSSLPVLFVMGFFSFLFGTFTTIFYAVTEALIGLVFGDCIHRRVDPTKTLFTVMILSAVVNVLNTIVLAELFGMNLEEEITEMQTMMEQVFSKSQMQLPENMLSPDFLKQIMVISMVLLGLLQGFIIYEISLLILRRLQFQIPKPKSIYEYFPPKWTAYLAVLLFFGSNLVLGSVQNGVSWANSLQTAGLCAGMYLMGFGFLGIMCYFRVYKGQSRVIGLAVCLAAYLIFPILLLVAGFAYIAADYHKKALEGKLKSV